MCRFCLFTSEQSRRRRLWGKRGHAENLRLTAEQTDAGEAVRAVRAHRCCPKRGAIRLTDPQGLEAMGRECYRIVRDEYDRLFS